jgi:hypothetical protein
MKSLLFVTLLALASGPFLRAEVQLAVIPQSPIVGVGSSTAAQVQISGLGVNSAPSLGAFDLQLGFTPSVLAFTGLTFGDPLQGDQLNLSGVGTISDFTLTSAGQVEFFSISLDSSTVLDALQASQFILATLNFQAIVPGSSNLSLGVNALSDSQGSPLSASLQAGNISVVPVPEPGAIWLFTLAAASLAACSLRSSVVQRSTPGGHALADRNCGRNL